MKARTNAEIPDPQWYLEQFRSHIGTIHELYKDCPTQQWKALSLAIRDALAEAREKVLPLVIPQSELNPPTKV